MVGLGPARLEVWWGRHAGGGHFPFECGLVMLLQLLLLSSSFVVVMSVSVGGLSAQRRGSSTHPMMAGWRSVWLLMGVMGPQPTDKYPYRWAGERESSRAAEQQSRQDMN